MGTLVEEQLRHRSCIETRRDEAREEEERERERVVLFNMFVNQLSASRPGRVATRRGRSNTLVVRALNFGKKTATTTKGKKEPAKKSGGLFGSVGSKAKPEPAKKSAGGGLFGSKGSKPKKASASSKWASNSRAATKDTSRTFKRERTRRERKQLWDTRALAKRGLLLWWTPRVARRGMAELCIASETSMAGTLTSSLPSSPRKRGPQPAIRTSLVCWALQFGSPDLLPCWPWAVFPSTAPQLSPVKPNYNR